MRADCWRPREPLRDIKAFLVCIDFFFDGETMTCKTITVEEERLARYRFCDSVIDSIERDCGDYLSYGECADLAHEIWAELPHSDRLKYYVKQQHFSVMETNDGNKLK
jgi:hypothetical protein